MQDLRRAGAISGRAREVRTGLDRRLGCGAGPIRSLYHLRRKIISGRLTDVTIVPQGDEYLMRFTGDDGAAFELVATFGQLDDLAEDIDRQLDADEAEASC